MPKVVQQPITTRRRCGDERCGRIRQRGRARDKRRREAIRASGAHDALADCLRPARAGALLYATVYLGGMAIIGLASFGLGPDAESGATLANYREVFASAHIQTVVLRTLRVSAITVIACLVLGFPVARYITSPDARWRSFVVMAVLSPLMVSAIGRVFGWIALFGPGSWVAAQTMHFFGTRATGLLYTEAGVVIGLTNILLPFMVLSIAASRANLDESLLKAAASLGATPSAVFWQVELPLNLPGILGGVLIVFSLSITNFATAALLGGSGRDVVAYEIYSNILTYHQPGTGTPWRSSCWSAPSRS
jgi:putative spermidine/putrescine transport system permease protein